MRFVILIVLCLFSFSLVAAQETTDLGVIEKGMMLEGSLEARDDSDFYTFDAQEGQTLLIMLQSEDFDPNLFLKTSNERWLAYDDMGTLGENAAVFYTIRETEQLTIEVAVQRGKTGGDYMLWVLPQCFDPETCPTGVYTHESDIQSFLQGGGDPDPRMIRLVRSYRIIGKAGTYMDLSAHTREDVGLTIDVRFENGERIALKYAHNPQFPPTIPRLYFPYDGRYIVLIYPNSLDFTRNLLFDLTPVNGQSLTAEPKTITIPANRDSDSFEHLLEPGTYTVTINNLGHTQTVLYNVYIEDRVLPDISEGVQDTPETVTFTFDIEKTSVVIIEIAKSIFDWDQPIDLEVSMQAE